MAVVVGDLGDAVAHVAGQDLALAQNLARHRIERIIVHADERAPQQIDPIEHQAARNARVAAAEIALGRADADRPRIAAQRQRMADAQGDALQDREVEVDDVPAGQHVRIEAPDALAEGLQRGALGQAPDRVRRHRAVAAVHDEHFVDPGGVQ